MTFEFGRNKIKGPKDTGLVYFGVEVSVATPQWRASRNLAQGEFIEWLAMLMDAGPRQKNKLEYIKEGRNLICDLSQKKALGGWTLLMGTHPNADAWTKSGSIPGRRK